MASLIHEIENNEALLLMFLSGELPPEDRAEVEQMLAGDAGLRAELARIESAYEFAISSLAELDADRAAVPGENHAIRQAKRAMKQWQIDRLNRTPASVPAARRRIPTWAYPAAVAAMLLIGTLTYWGIVGDQGGNYAQKTDNPSSGGDQTTQVQDDPKTSLTKDDLLQQSLDGSGVRPDIAFAETQANTLMARSDDSSVALSIFLDDSAK